MIKVSTTRMVVSLKTDLRFPIPGQQGHGSRIIHCKSKKFNVANHECDEDGVILKLFLQCEECGEITPINFSEE